jgi:hypothetical protein
MAKYGPARAKRTIPTDRENILATVLRADTVTVAVGSDYDRVCAEMVAEGTLIVVSEPTHPLLGRTYGKGW